MPPTSSPGSYHPLIARLLALHNNSEKYKTAAGSDARATLAILRRGMQNRLSQITPVEMFPALSQEFFLADESHELPGMMIASLYANVHKSVIQTDNASLGRSLRELAKKRQSGSLELRVMAMLKADLEHLPGHLRQLLSLLETEEIGLDWNLLLLHVFNWEHPEGYVQKRIVRDYYSDPFYNPSNPLENESGDMTTNSIEGI